MPSPTRRMTEMMPQTMPNIVRKLRSFVSQRAVSVCLRISRRGIRVTCRKPSRLDPYTDGGPSLFPEALEYRLRTLSDEIDPPPPHLFSQIRLIERLNLSIHRQIRPAKGLAGK